MSNQRQVAATLKNLEKAAEAVAEASNPKLCKSGALSDKQSLVSMLQTAFGSLATTTAKSFRSALVAVDCFLHRQLVGLKKRITVDDAGAGVRFVGVERSWDEASSRVYLGPHEQMEHLVRDLGLPHEALQNFNTKRPAVTMSILQQRCTVRVDDYSAPVCLLGKLLQNGTASNIHAALVTSVPAVAPAALNCSPRGPLTLLGCRGDAVAANEAVITKFKTEWANMSVAERQPYVLVVGNARENRKVAARRNPDGPPPPVIQVPEFEQLSSADSRWSCGNVDFPVAPSALREHAGGVRSMIKLATDIEAKTRDITTIGGFFCPDAPAADFNLLQLRR